MGIGRNEGKSVDSEKERSKGTSQTERVETENQGVNKRDNLTGCPNPTDSLFLAG